MLAAIGDVMRRVYERGWITTRDGTISMRKRTGKYLHITPSGSRKTIVHLEHIVRLDVVSDPASGEAVQKVLDGQRPFGELWMHWNLQRDTKKMRTVVHVQATHIVVAIYDGIDLQAMSAEFQEISRCTRVRHTVPALPTLSRELADVTAECLGLRKDGTMDSTLRDDRITVCVQSQWILWGAYEHIEGRSYLGDCLNEWDQFEDFRENSGRSEEIGGRRP